MDASNLYARARKGVAPLVVTALLASTAAAQKKGLDIQGHRGCRGLMPENTIPAMLHALELGVTTLEMDAAITADGKVVLSHEPYMSALISTRPDGTYMSGKEDRGNSIFKMTYAELQLWDVGMKPNPGFPRQRKMKAVKPLLSDVFDSVELRLRESKGKRVRYNIETKCSPSGDGIYHPEPERFVDLLMEVVKSKGLANRVTIQSFDKRTLQVLHRKYPRVATSLLIDRSSPLGMDAHLEQLGFTPTVYSPEYRTVDEALLRACHAKGMRLVAWTVNDRPSIDRLVAMGVDGIITDYPDLFPK